MVVEYENGEFLYLHFNSEGNLDFTYNELGIIKFIDSFKYKEDYLISRESNNFFIKDGDSKYENLAPFSFLFTENKWNFVKGNSSTSFMQALSNNVEFFNVFKINYSVTVSTVANDNSSKLEAEVIKNFSNKKYIFMMLFNAINASSAAFFKIRITPYYENVAKNKKLKQKIIFFIEYLLIFTIKLYHRYFFTSTFYIILNFCFFLIAFYHHF